MRIRIQLIVFLILLSVFPTYRNSSTPLIERSIELLTPEEELSISEYFSQPLIQQIDSVLNIYHKRYGFHGTVLVARHGYEIYKGAFGTANFSTKRQLVTDDIFQLASVSKQFTAMSVLMLKERNQLKLTDTLTKFFPQLSYNNITIKQLLNHTAGCPNYMWLLEHKWDTINGIPNNMNIIDLMAKYNLPLYFTPGRRFEYSNTGYMLLAAIVEKVSKEPFDKFLHENIFQPLAMENSFAFSTSNKLHDSKTKKRIPGYYRRHRRYYPIESTIHDGGLGDKNVFSTVEDLYKWDQALYSNTLVSEQTLQEAFTPAKNKRGYHYAYGYGFRLREHNNQQVVYHNGLWEGFRNNFHRYIEQKNTIIVLSHTNNSINNTIQRKIEYLLDNATLPDATFNLASILLHEGLESGKQYSDTANIDTDLLHKIIPMLKAWNKTGSAEQITAYCRWAQQH